jgi:hypothetical protein
MKPLNFEELKAVVLSKDMTHEELLQLQAAVGLRLGHSRTALRQTVEVLHDLDQMVGVFYSCWADLVLRTLGDRVPYLGEVRQRNAKLFKEVVECAGSLRQFAEQKLPRKLSRPELVTLYTLYLRLAFDNCRTIGGNITTQRVMGMRDRIGTLLDQSFPGYVGNGMLEVILSGKLTPLGGK